MSLSPLLFIPVTQSPTAEATGFDSGFDSALNLFETNRLAVVQAWPNTPQAHDLLRSQLEASPQSWLLFWGDARITPQHPELWQQWLQELTAPKATYLWAYACGQLEDGLPTPRPTAAQEWLLHQNVAGPVLLMRASLFLQLPTAALLAEPTPQGLLHALALHACTQAPNALQRQQALLYKVPSPVEASFRQAHTGWQQRLKQWSQSHGYVLELLSSEENNASFLNNASLVNEEAKAEVRLSPPNKTPETTPALVSILLPFKNKPELLKQCLDSLLERAEAYPHFEVLGIDNQSNEPALFDLMRHYEARDSRIRFLTYPHPFNYAAINNWAARQAKGDYLLLLNNDIELISTDWLKALLNWAQWPEVGAVGAKLYYPNNTIQHAGCTLGIWGTVGHPFKGSPKTENPSPTDPWGWTSIPRNVMAVTAACLLLKTKDYWAVGGMDETHFVVAYNDIDLCLKLHQQGLRNLITPHCEAYHHESVTRGKRRNPEQKRQEAYEGKVFRQRYQALLEAGDPYWSRYLSLLSEVPELTAQPEIEGAFEKAFFARLPFGWEFRLFRKQGKLLPTLRKRR